MHLLQVLPYWYCHGFCLLVVLLVMPYHQLELEQDACNLKVKESDTNLFPTTSTSTTICSLKVQVGLKF